MKRWTVVEDMYLQAHYQEQTDEELAKHFRCHPSQVATRRYTKGLKRGRRNLGGVDRGRRRRKTCSLTDGAPSRSPA